MREHVERSAGFAPLESVDARTLILGSLPSRRSIECNQYYAHSRNAFWPIMANLVAATGSYEERCKVLGRNQIAVWDVLASSVRPGSLDSDIDLTTAEVNDFTTFFAEHAALERICFNGQAAAKIFRQRVARHIVCSNLQMVTLPSTSPAHAAMNFEQKLELWGLGTGLIPDR